MAGKPIGTIYAELDLDTSKYTAAQKKILYDSQTLAINQENAWRNLGQKSDVMYEAMRKQAENAYKRIASDSKSSASEVIRAEEAKNAKIKALNEQQFGAQTSLIDSLKKNWIAVSAAIYGAYALISKAFDLIETGAKVKALEDSFALVAKGVGISADKLISDLKRVTNETIDDSDLMKKAMRLMVEGFSSDQIVQLGAAARVAARLMGTDVSEAYEQVADSIVNLRQRGLKTAGFVIDLEEAYAKHAKTLNVTKDQLNDYGKQMALMNAVAEKTIELQKKLGIEAETASERIQKQKTIWKELGENLAKAASEAWQLVNALVQLGLSKVPKIGPETWGGRTAPTPSTKLGYGEWEAGPYTGATTPTGKSQIQIDLYAQKYGISEAELKERLSMSRLLREELYEQWQIEGKILTVENELAQQYANDMFPALEKVNAMIDQGNKYWIDQNKQLAISQFLIKEMDWESVASGLTTLSSDTERAITQTTIAIERQVDSLHQTEDVIKSISQSISDVWATNMSRMIMDSKNAKEALSNIWKGMADVFVSAIMKMITNLILFQNVQGNYSSGQGLMGWLGGLFTSSSASPVTSGAPRTAEGGIFYTPQIRSIAERKPEAVIPLERLKGGDVFVNVINNAPNTKTETKESQDGRGNRSVEIIISELVAKEIGRTGSAPNRAIREMGGENSLIRR